MARLRKLPNPFYVLVVVAGTAFALTASGYFVMSYRAIQGPAQGGESASGGRLSESASGGPLMAFIDMHGLQLMVGELGLLAVATIGAIGTDHWWNPPKVAKNRLPNDVTKMS
jgi:hypothetical protein